MLSKVLFDSKNFVRNFGELKSIGENKFIFIFVGLM
jgi:hypothetical protein